MNISVRDDLDLVEMSKEAEILELFDLLIGDPEVRYNIFPLMALSIGHFFERCFSDSTNKRTKPRLQNDF